MQPYLDDCGTISHTYFDGKGVEWSFDCLFDAYKQYQWAFSFEEPEGGGRITGRDVRDSLNALNRLRNGLRQALTEENPNACRRYCFAMLQWGGVTSHNKATIEKQGDDLAAFLQRASNVLDLSTYDTQRPPTLKFTSGLGKIYHLIVDGLIMYDSRVAAGLSVLVRDFCISMGRHRVPRVLEFHLPFPRSHHDRRNPSIGPYRFSGTHNRSDKHMNSNVKASWLLRAVLDGTHSSFDDCERDADLTALQSALFMIGYDIRGFRTRGAETDY